MREHVKAEVAFEVLAMCLALAIEKKDVSEIKRLEEMKRKLEQGDRQVLALILNDYGNKVKKALEVKRK